MPKLGQTYTPSEIRDLGENTCPGIAETYDQQAFAVNAADLLKDKIFGLHPLGAEWVELFDVYRKAVLETPISLESMGRTLVTVADSCEEDEDVIIKDLDGVMDAIPAENETDREDVAQEREERERADEEMSDNFF